MASDRYFRIYFDDEEISIIEMQWFDESGYNQNQFLSEKWFKTQDQALAYCREGLKKPNLPSNIKIAINKLICDDIKYILD